MMSVVRPSVLPAGFLACSALTNPAFADCSQSGGTIICEGDVGFVVYHNQANSLILQALTTDAAWQPPAQVVKAALPQACDPVG